MFLEKFIRDSFKLRVIRQEFTDNGSENRILFQMPSGDRVELLTNFKHVHGLSEWNPAKWCKINEIPHHDIDLLFELLGNGDADKGLEFFDELIAEALDQDRWDFNEFLIDQNPACGGI